MRKLKEQGHAMPKKAQIPKRYHSKHDRNRFERLGKVTKFMVTPRRQTKGIRGRQHITKKETEWKRDWGEEWEEYREGKAKEVETRILVCFFLLLIYFIYFFGFVFLMNGERSHKWWSPS